ncbi:MIND complex subunit DSN1 TDEL_0H02720 [Torulaspora delbrueckii]|uniref:Kinetochore protein mis13 n=1 Tax=Torulaspora delbrueckii TaxID=4950 RepID=G8ZZT7_TORDE|nr:hypothetical protein TDEL_0H02720 [Torulaspora delbrueckii]CCE94131.1 hypothetical protein TDEL_0H02720 [Torulaspora delbrueckii]
MSLDGSRSVSKTPPRKKSYPLKMETIPMSSSSYAEFKETRNDEEQEDEYNVGKPNASSFEADQDFKFKRHRNKQSNGVPSLGERLDNLQDVKKAKWVDNFNSSMPNVRETTTNGVHSPRVPAADQGYPSSQPVPPYIALHVLLSDANSRYDAICRFSCASDTDGESAVYELFDFTQFFSATFFPPAQQTKFDQETPQLLPPPNLYPYNYVQSQQQYAKKASDRRKSIAQNRGRRLSILASQDDGHGIVSPHRDVSEKDFYRHIGDTSFGKGLQMRQLFNWCTIRALRRLEEKETNQTSRRENGEYVDPKKIALVIMKEFVNDLRRGSIDIDWEAEEAAANSGDDNEVGEDTELRELFDDDDGEKKIRRKKMRFNIEGRKKVPNSKNVENEKNLKILESRVKNLKDEIESWAQVLGKQKPEAEWEVIDKQFSLPNQDMAIDEVATTNVSQDLTRRLDRLQVHSHLLDSSSKAFFVLLKARRDKLTQSFAATVRDNTQQIDSKSILKSLSKSLTER